MATPIGHSLAGYAISNFSGKTTSHDRLSMILLCLVMANAPDLDFIPGLLLGKPALYHQGITHSLGFAILVSMGVAGIFYTRGKSFPKIFWLCFISYLSHLIIDFFCPDRRLPFGIPLLWPISGEHFISPVPLFLGVQHAEHTSASTIEWFGGIFSLYNIGAIALEVLLLAPFIFFGLKYRKKTLS
jgi:membrane-bound metal-dependent hydrolase YbcI (DUF457 family)